MMSAALDGNPLLDVLPPEMTRVELSAWLEQSPGDDPIDPSDIRRWLESAFAVTPKSLEVARAILRCMRQSAHMQDPRTLANRVRAFRVDEILSGARVLSGDAPTANGFCLEGITGVGKSHVIKHVLSRIPQLVHHGENAACEMKGLRQLVHLTVQLSGDGTPFAFFSAALNQMDSLLGTEYLKEALRQRSGAQALLVYFMKKVLLHRVLFIAVEEAQQSNMDFTKYAVQFKGMFINLLNFCVPVGVIGNPLGIKPLLENAQVMRRLTAAGRFRIEPAFSPSEALWADDYVAGVWHLSPLPSPDEVWCTQDELDAWLWGMTGGFPSHLVLLRCEAICEAMDRGSPRVEKVDVVKAFRSAQYAGTRLLSKIFTARTVPESKKFRDIDWTHYEECWLEQRAAGGDSEQASGGDEGAAANAAARTASCVPEPMKKDRSEPVAPRGTPGKGKSTTAGAAADKDALSADDVRSPSWTESLPESVDT